MIGKSPRGAHLTMAVVRVAGQHGMALGENAVALITSCMSYKVTLRSSYRGNP